MCFALDDAVTNLRKTTLLMTRVEFFIALFSRGKGQEEGVEEDIHLLGLTKAYTVHPLFTRQHPPVMIPSLNEFS